MKLKFISICSLVLGVFAIGIYEGCKPENFGDGNGLTSTDLASSFTITPVANKTNYYALKANETGVLALKWDKGDGTSNLGKAIDTVFFPDAGKYTVKLTTIGKGGTQVTSSQDVTVAASDLIAGNLVQGGKMQAGDDAKWTHFTISPGVTFTMNSTSGQMVALGGNGGHAAVYQAINVVAGKKYKVDMNVSGSGATDTWFEVYADFPMPVAGKDYPSTNKLISLNTWAGCGNGSFNGKLSAISCSGSGNTFKFTQSGTVYLVIKSGGSNLGATGISFTNVEFRGTN